MGNEMKRILIWIVWVLGLSALATASVSAWTTPDDGRFEWRAGLVTPEHTWKHGNDVTAVAFSPDGQRVLTGSWDNTVVLRDAQSGQTLHTWRHEDWVHAVAFSPDGRRVLIGLGSWKETANIAVLRDADIGTILHNWQHNGPVRSVAFSPDGHRVLTGSADKTVVLRSGSVRLNSNPRFISGHRAGVDNSGRTTDFILCGLGKLG